jgi:hypothetical protein
MSYNIINPDPSIHLFVEVRGISRYVLAGGAASGECRLLDTRGGSVLLVGLLGHEDDTTVLGGGNANGLSVYQRPIPTSNPVALFAVRFG